MIPCSFQPDGCACMVERACVAAHEETCEFRSATCRCGERVRCSHWREHEQVRGEQGAYACAHLRACLCALLWRECVYVCASVLHKEPGGAKVVMSSAH